MLSSSRQAIDHARKNLGNADAIANAEAAISNELARAPFSGLLHLLSDYERKPVFLRQANANQKKHDVNVNACLEKFREGREQQGKPKLTQREETALFGEARIYKPYQSVRIVKESKIVIVVHSLDPRWLEQKVEQSPLTNADLVHTANHVIKYAPGFGQGVPLFH